ncbi:MAG: hypothetical protein HYX68_20970 [Planctomycetes bacterium]|jgi:signal peptidase I|nr:hypothetical protein [Planctomycetota bacterium]
MAEENPPVAAGVHPDPATAVKAEGMKTPPIPLEPAQVKSPPAPVIGDKKDAETKDTFRELIETVVFVVVLVLMLKTFLAEAFVIPTGSMATTLLGYHHKKVCEQCGRRNLINASEEAEPRNPNARQEVGRWQCENCQYVNEMFKGKGPPR